MRIASVVGSGIEVGVSVAIRPRAAVGLALGVTGLLFGAAPSPGQGFSIQEELKKPRLNRFVPALAALGDADAQKKLGEHHLTQSAGAIDPAQGVTWLRRAAEQGDTGAQAALGEILWEGKVTTRDPVEAFQWTMLAAKGSTYLREAYSERLGPMMVAMTSEEQGRASALVAAWQPKRSADPEAEAEAWATAVRRAEPETYVAYLLLHPAGAHAAEALAALRPGGGSVAAVEHPLKLGPWLAQGELWLMAGSVVERQSPGGSLKHGPSWRVRKALAPEVLAGRNVTPLQTDERPAFGMDFADVRTTLYLANDPTGLFAIAVRIENERSPERPPFVFPSPVYLVKSPYRVGSQWSEEESGFSATATITAARATVSVPAGTFDDCLIVVSEARLPNGGIFQQVVWLSPQAGEVKSINLMLDPPRDGAQATLWELERRIGK